ncbi:MAG: HPr family phosphocarrier protein [Thauera sp.]|nr:HPr family phosphocarrier protein [Thauera sp.]
MPEAEAEIINRLGLHARASAKLTQLAASFDAEVELEANDRRVNAKSIMGIMMLAAAQGSQLTIHTSGAEAEAALAAVLALIADRFGEEE